MIIEKWDETIVDIDNTFQNGDLDHEIYMSMPEGYVECVDQVEENEALKIEKAIYGIVQAARQFFKKVQDSLIQACFKSRKADPSLVYKEDQNGVCIILVTCWLLEKQKQQVKLSKCYNNHLRYSHQQN